MKQSYCEMCDTFLPGRHFSGRICAKCGNPVGRAARERLSLDGPISLPTDLRNARLELAE